LIALPIRTSCRAGDGPGEGQRTETTGSPAQAI
jgi:hypothetical protein